MTRSVEALVDEQARRWELLRKHGTREGRRPVITISRQHGARGEELGQRLAADLGFDFFDHEIIHRIAESSHLSERVISSLDEKNRELLTDWLAAVADQSYLSPAEYRYHLTRVVGAIAHLGGAVILGRGSHLILGPGQALRVFVVAPLEHRVRTIMERHELSERDARRRIIAVESDLRAYLMQHFHADLGDPAQFDVTVNTGSLEVDGGCGVVRSALTRLPQRSTRDAIDSDV
jgi:Cytidylate kinase-like family